MDYCNLRHEFIAKKLIAQSRKFKDFELHDLYRSLDRIDENCKVGRESLDVALEGLIAHICL
jgi:hypothetical protein